MEELTPRQMTFLADEMERIEQSDTRPSYEQNEAQRLRRKAEQALTE